MSMIDLDSISFDTYNTVGSVRLLIPGEHATSDTLTYGNSL
jgi:hypothetical protein